MDLTLGSEAEFGPQTVRQVLERVKADLVREERTKLEAEPVSAREDAVGEICVGGEGEGSSGSRWAVGGLARDCGEAGGVWDSAVGACGMQRRQRTVLGKGEVDDGVGGSGAGRCALADAGVVLGDGGMGLDGQGNCDSFSAVGLKGALGAGICGCLGMSPGCSPVRIRPRGSSVVVVVCRVGLWHETFDQLDRSEGRLFCRFAIGETGLGIVRCRGPLSRSGRSAAPTAVPTGEPPVPQDKRTQRPPPCFRGGRCFPFAPLRRICSPAGAGAPVPAPAPCGPSRASMNSSSASRDAAADFSAAVAALSAAQLSCMASGSALQPGTCRSAPWRWPGRAEAAGRRAAAAWDAAAGVWHWSVASCQWSVVRTQGICWAWNRGRSGSCPARPMTARP